MKKQTHLAKARQKTLEKQAERARLSEAQNHRCAYCGVVMRTNGVETPESLTVDHIICLVDGGTTNNDNLVAACRRCNNDRSDTNALDYYAQLHPEYVRNAEDDAYFGTTIEQFLATQHLYVREPDVNAYHGVLAAKFVAQNGQCATCPKPIPFLGGKIVGSLFGANLGMEDKVAVCKNCRNGKTLHRVRAAA